MPAANCRSAASIAASTSEYETVYPLPDPNAAPSRWSSAVRSNRKFPVAPKPTIPNRVMWLEGRQPVQDRSTVGRREFCGQPLWPCQWTDMPTQQCNPGAPTPLPFHNQSQCYCPSPQQWVPRGSRCPLPPLLGTVLERLGCRGSPSRTKTVDRGRCRQERGGDDDS